MDNKSKQLIEKLYNNSSLDLLEYQYLIDNRDEESFNYLSNLAFTLKQKYYGNKVFMRGLIELTNYCKNDCYYCGIRASNKNANRYRLTKEEILECCEIGYELGYRTFVLQGGEDNYYNDELMCDIIKSIREKYLDCAITLSIGEKSYDTYKKYFDAGANRYLLRHETADKEHYSKIHPQKMSYENRIECLYNLKKIGYQVGTGFMVGSPFQTSNNLAKDMVFIKELKPSMIGIGPFIPHHDTQYKNEKHGSVELTLFMIGLIRLTLPNSLIPATTALGTIDNNGREKGLKAGANVIMPNLSPLDVRKKYLLYDNKISTGEEAAESRALIEKRIKSIGQELVIDRGDVVNI